MNNNKNNIAMQDHFTIGNLLELDARGLNVIPLRPQAKTPYLPSWDKWKTNKVPKETLQHWHESYLDANWGIVCGAVSGIVVIDADDEPAMKWVENVLPDTPVMTTTTKGRHYYYRHPGQGVTVPPAVKLNGRNIDRRGDGSYVVAPGSTHPSGHVYSEVVPWTPEAFDSMPTYDPAWFPAPTPAAPQQQTTTTARTDVNHTAAISDPALPLVATRLAAAKLHMSNCKGAEQGRGADSYALAIAISLLWDFALPTADATDLMEAWGQRSDQMHSDGTWYPWTSKEIRHKVESAAAAHIESERIGCKIRNLNDDLDDRLSQIIKGVDVPEKEERPKRTPKFRGYFIEDLKNMKPVGWLVDQHLTDGGILTLFGQSGSFKSFIAIDMALSVAHGTPFLGKYAARKGKVAYLCSEGFPLLRKRVEAWYAARGLTPDHEFFAIDGAGNLADPNVRDEVMYAAEYGLGGKPDLVIIDTLSKNFGGMSTNEGDKMQAWYDSVMEWRVSTVVVHHAGWSSERERGSSNVRDNSTATFRCVKGTRDATGRLVCEITCLKQKDHTEVEQYLAVGVSVGADDPSLVFGAGHNLNPYADLVNKFPTDPAKGRTLKDVFSEHMVFFEAKGWGFRTLQNKLSEAVAGGHLSVSPESPAGRNIGRMYYVPSAGISRVETLNP